MDNCRHYEIHKLYLKLRATPSNSSDYNEYTTNLQTYNRILRQNILLAKKTYYNKCFENFKYDRAHGQH